MFDDNDDTPVTLTINKSYANKYETWRGKEEKQKCKKDYSMKILNLFLINFSNCKVWK